MALSLLTVMVDPLINGVADQAATIARDAQYPSPSAAAGSAGSEPDRGCHRQWPPDGEHRPVGGGGRISSCCWLAMALSENPWNSKS